MQHQRRALGRNLGHRGLRLWRELYGMPPPREDGDGDRMASCPVPRSHSNNWQRDFAIERVQAQAPEAQR
jgi:hypothetical protein